MSFYLASNVFYFTLQIHLCPSRLVSCSWSFSIHQFPFFYTMNAACGKTVDEPRGASTDQMEFSDDKDESSIDLLYFQIGNEQLLVYLTGFTQYHSEQVYLHLDQSVQRGYPLCIVHGKCWVYARAGIPDRLWHDCFLFGRREFQGLGNYWWTNVFEVERAQKSWNLNVWWCYWVAVIVKCRPDVGRRGEGVL